ncbi:kinase sensor component of a two component signal transduction system [Acinetobacter nosocomialis]|nr:kinase sensor component of a two component signal transduction system [Acinetobacter nosocomialis]SSP73157.1 kinase sensor component of a two component signal transduction system [Acinetobacter nosocomialis]SSQ41812.1 kinase sensor component of a two component signal transduction system [Acinetobacter baumannii]
MNVLRVPIALRLFLTVLLTTLLIATASLSVLHWTMQKNFAKYVADVEMQKLDRLMTNLGNVYNVYHDWGNAIQAQILQIEGTAAPDDYDRLSQWWLRRQYDIAIQQHSFDEHTLINVSPDGASPDSFRIDKAQQRIWYQQKSLSLTPTEFRLLELFLEHVGQVYSRAQLLDHINPDSFDVADRVIDSHIKNLRRKITEVAETGNRHEWIQAVYGVGYRFEYPEE